MEEPSGEATFCRLQYAVGRIEECGRARCAFWEPGGAVLPGRCAFDELDLSGRPAVAQLLLQIRVRLADTAVAEHDTRTRRLFYHLLNEGDGE
jgi:hypothetical protein